MIQRWSNTRVAAHISDHSRGDEPRRHLVDRVREREEVTHAVYETSRNLPVSTS